MEGLISEHPLAELISEILEKRFSGALRVDRERAKAVVYFDAGLLVYATSNLRNLRLGEYFRKRGIPTEALGATDFSSDSALAADILSRGLIPKATLDEIISEQVADVVRVLLLWISGHWSFDERARLTEPVRAQIPVKQLLLDAARRTDLRFVASRFVLSTELISRSTNSAIDLNLSATEGFLLSRVEGPMELAELITISGMREPDARRTIFALVLTGLLHRESWPYAFRTSESQKTADAKKQSAAAEVPSKPPSAPARNPREELMEFLDRLTQATNHYEVLSVRLEADAGEIKHAYYALARRFHPDRFHDLARTTLHAQLESAFARITQAHETLSDPESKTTYDAKLSALRRAGKASSQAWSAGKPSAEEHAANGSADPKLAEQRFNEGVTALHLGELNTATACLSAAARLAPNQPHIRAYYGRALAAHPQTKRLAEAELQAAVKLDPGNASYRVMLAGLYRDLGFQRRAITELERALSLDSKNAEARRMLQNLEAKK
jgi:hypothetical protein